MKVGIIQPNYIPWRGYFDFIDDSDLFIFYDDVPYGQGKKWRNRNLIKTKGGLSWLTIPICHNQSILPINQVLIDYSSEWPKDHLNKLYESYHKAPHWHDYADEYCAIINRRHPSISELDIELCKWIMTILEIHTKTMRSRDFEVPPGDKSTRPISLLKKIGAKTYLTGPNTESYINVGLFQSQGLNVEFKCYDYAPYNQLWGAFVNQVSILDLLFNAGPSARQYLKSKTPNRVK
jgi:hypothetical protein